MYLCMYVYVCIYYDLVSMNAFLNEKIVIVKIENVKI